MSALLHSLSNLLFPPLCLHCRSNLPPKNKVFCHECLYSLELIDPIERCPFCFSMDYQIEQRICQICVRMPPLLDGVASAFDYIGAAATWIKKMKYGDRPYLAEGAAAYLAAQWVRLGWSYPDLIIPVPLSRIRRFERGYNQSELLASHLSEILNVPMKLILGRKSGDFSQAGLSRKQRMALSEQSFYLKLKDDFQGKKLLLIDDVMTTGSTLRRCAEVLLEKEPGPIQALVLCRAIK